MSWSWPSSDPLAVDIKTSRPIWIAACEKLHWLSIPLDRDLNIFTCQPRLYSTDRWSRTTHHLEHDGTCLWMHSTISNKCTLKHCSIKSAEVSVRRPPPLRPQPSSTSSVYTSVSTSMQGLMPPAQIVFLTHFIATVPLNVTGQCPNWHEIASEDLQISLSFFFFLFPKFFPDHSKVAWIRLLYSDPLPNSCWEYFTPCYR